MSKFKVGDRVRVDTPESDFMCRGESYLGDYGTVDSVYQEGCDVRIERDGECWVFGNEEISLIEPAPAPETIIFRDLFAMAALTGLCADSGTSGVALDVMARTSYALADAMLAERVRIP